MMTIASRLDHPKVLKICKFFTLFGKNSIFKERLLFEDEMTYEI